MGSFCVFQAEDGIRELVRSRGLGDVYKRQGEHGGCCHIAIGDQRVRFREIGVSQVWADLRRHDDDLDTSGNVVEIVGETTIAGDPIACLLYTSDAADQRSRVDLGGRRTIKKNKNKNAMHV